MARFSALLSLVLTAVLSTTAQEIPNPPVNDFYQSGRMHMNIMAIKEDSFAFRRNAGLFNSTQYRNIDAYTPCVNGFAAEYRCNNIDLYSFLSHSSLGSARGEGSSSWGWVSPEGREIIIIAQADGAAFAEVLPSGQLDYLGRLPQTVGASPSIWREIRVWKNYAIVGSEAQNHHVQIFDLNKVVAITPAEKPKTFNPTTDVTGLFKGLPVGRTHNVVAHPTENYIVSVGSAPRTSNFRAGLVFIDVTNPANPTLAGYAAQDGYVHDAQCLLYKGPDPNYQGRDICYGYNEDTLTIYDVTNKANATIISRTSYVGAAYTHQGWVLDPEDQRYLLLDDEYDEYNRKGPAADGFAVTYIWDIQDLRAPKQTGYYKSSNHGVDHNQYVANGKSFQSNYGGGLRILDVSSIPSDPTGAGVAELGFFDVYPEDDNEPSGGVVDFVGSWSSYGLFPSGFIVINTIERGAFVVKLVEDFRTFEVPN